jgi:flagellar basal-body rod protein FlgB
MDGGAPGPGTDTVDPSLPVPIFDNTQLALERAISGASMRHEVLANNLANAETPGFQRSDVDFHTTLAQAMKTGEAASIESAPFQPQRDNQTLRADGNGVDVDVESSNLAKNSLEYDALISVARARIGILKSAMGVG